MNDSPTTPPPNEDAVGKEAFRLLLDESDTMSSSDEASAGEKTFHVAPPQKSAGAAASQPDLPLPDELTALLPAGAYKVEGFLGQGGMGAVYKGMQVRLKRAVAIKIMRRDFGKDFDFETRFEREAQAMAKLNHPGIVAVHDYGEAGPDYLYIVMELVDGADLMDVIRTGRMTQEMALTLLPQICDALQFAHDHGIVHRDIKPSNIMLTRDGRIKMADFGLAKLFDAESGFRTQTGTGMGTPDYAAPEQFDPAGAVDHRADIYALGVMIYQMITGSLPRGVWKPPSQRAQVSTQWDAVVSRAMQNDPGERYQTASEVKTDVSSILLHQGRAAAPSAAVSGPSSTNRPKAALAGASGLPKAKSRAPVHIAASVITLFVLVGAGWKMLQSGRKSSAEDSSAQSVTDSATASRYPVGKWTKVALTGNELTETHSSLNAEGELSVYTLLVPGLTARNLAIRGDIKRLPETKSLSLLMRRGPSGSRSATIGAKQSLLQLSLGNNQFPTLSKLDYPAGPLDLENRVSFQFACIGETSFGTVQGRVIPPAKSSQKVEPGTVMFACAAKVRNLEILNLDGLPEAEALKLVAVGIDAGTKTSPTVFPAPGTDSPMMTTGIWKPMFTDAEWREVNLPSREFKAGILHVTGYAMKPQLAADGAIRALIQIPEEHKATCLRMRDSGDSYYELMLLSPQDVWLRCFQNITGRPEDKAKITAIQLCGLKKPWAAGDKVSLELRAEGTRLTAKVDNATLFDGQDNHLTQSGDWGVFSRDTLIESLEVVTPTLTGGSPPSGAKAATIDAIWKSRWSKPGRLRGLGVDAEGKAIDLSAAGDHADFVQVVNIAHASLFRGGKRWLALRANGDAIYSDGTVDPGCIGLSQGGNRIMADGTARSSVFTPPAEPVLDIRAAEFADLPGKLWISAWQRPDSTWQVSCPAYEDGTMQRPDLTSGAAVKKVDVHSHGVGVLRVDGSFRLWGVHEVPLPATVTEGAKDFVAIGSQLSVMIKDGTAWTVSFQAKAPGADALTMPSLKNAGKGLTAIASAGFSTMVLKANGTWVPAFTADAAFLDAVNGFKQAGVTHFRAASNNTKCLLLWIEPEK